KSERPRAAQTGEDKRPRRFLFRRAGPVRAPLASRPPPHTTLAAGDAVEDLQPTVDGAVVGGITETEVRVGSTEDVAGNQQQVVADAFAYKFRAAAPRRPREEIERPLRFDQLEAIFQSLPDAVALAVV